MLPASDVVHGLGTTGQKHCKSSESRQGSRDGHREGETEERQPEGVEGTGAGQRQQDSWRRSVTGEDSPGHVCLID